MTDETAPHLSDVGKTAIIDVLDRLNKGERVIVASVEQLVGERVQLVGSSVTTDVPKWLVYVIVVFAVFGLGHLIFDLLRFVNLR